MRHSSKVVGQDKLQRGRRGSRRMPQATSVSAHLTRMATVSMAELCGVHIVDFQRTIGCACEYKVHLHSHHQSVATMSNCNTM